MKTLNIEKCPLCESTNIEQLSTCIDHYASGEKFTICQCRDCQFRFTQGAPVESEIGRYYETTDYISHSDTRKGLMNKVYHWVRQYMLGKKARMVINESHIIGGNLLDVGAGTGYFANEMAQRGWKIIAAEKSPQARDFARKNFDIEVVDSSCLTDLIEKSFDVITMWHVMEHVENINQEWDTIYRLLSDKGRFIMAVPNCSSADEQIYSYDWAAYDVPRHLWHFTPKTLRAMAKKHGFIMTRMKPMPFDAFYISMLSEKYRGEKHFFIKGMISGLKCYFRASGKTDKSSSVIYIFKKKQTDNGTKK